MENIEIKLSWPKKWLEICATFFKDGVEEMMKNASCYIILFLVNN